MDWMPHFVSKTIKQQNQGERLYSTRAVSSGLNSFGNWMEMKIEWGLDTF
jgi:hypothetical protein